ncbi:phosphatidate cytidylyltransferase [Streptomyces fractus]|uniref:phosphatidate cytidylyltransferase n=1 Tax=Streptomyces fractus TaxID=641806 RepID=UPI003CF80E00
MNDSSWGAPSGPGHWGPTDDQGSAPGQGPAYGQVPAYGQGPSYNQGPSYDHGRAPAGPAYERHAVDETRPMPIVPDMPDTPSGDGRGDDQDDRGAARLSGPLFRDEAPRRPEPAERPAQPSDPAGSSQAPQSSQPEPPKKKSAGRDLGAAIGVGVGLGAVVIGSLFIVKAVFVGVIAVAVVVGLWELTSRLDERKGIRAPLVPLAVGGAAMVVAGYVRGAEGAWVAMALTALAVLVWRMTEPPEGYLKDVTAGVFAAFYVPFLATFVAMMLTADDGAWRVLTFLILTVVSDTGAYAVGWRFGKHKLAPRISPGKTREGLLGAVSFAMVAGVLCMQFLVDDGTWWQGLVMGALVAASATLGDLGESMIKRDLGIKDMGTLLPGHGGIMDRLDSLLPTAPVVWLLLVLFVGS